MISKYTFDEFEADLKSAELRRQGVRLRLQLQPFQVLVALLERPQEVITRDELRQRLWPGDTFVDFDHSLNTAIAKLRDVLGDSASSPRYVETIAKRGYRFLATVAAIEETGPIASPPADAGVIPAPASKPSESPSEGMKTSEFPRAGRRTIRVLFTLSQLMYLSFYLSALFRLDRLDQSASKAWNVAGGAMFIVYLASALVGIVVRLYLVAATALDYHLLGQKYRVLFPALFALDMLWALSPLLIADRIGLGLALGAVAALIYMPFTQRTLVKMMEGNNSIQFVGS
jgi:cholera toxin transcriptional activator